MHRFICAAEARRESRAIVQFTRSWTPVMMPPVLTYAEVQEFVSKLRVQIPKEDASPTERKDQLEKLRLAIADGVNWIKRLCQTYLQKLTPIEVPLFETERELYAFLDKHPYLAPMDLSPIWNLYADPFLRRSHEWNLDCDAKYHIDGLYTLRKPLQSIFLKIGKVMVQDIFNMSCQDAPMFIRFSTGGGVWI